MARAHWALGAAGASRSRGRPSRASTTSSRSSRRRSRRPSAQGVRGPAITPFVLARLHERSDGRTLRANRELIVGNAALAGEVAVALSAL